MGNNNSGPSKAQYGSKGSNVASEEPHYVAVAPKPRKLHSMSQGTQPAEQHGKKQLRNDEALTTYIKDAKYKMKSKSNIGGHEEQSNHIPVDVTNETNKENEKDHHFSDFIQNARKKLRTVTRRNSSIRRG